MSARRGLFLSFEGIDGSGKSTMVEYVGRWLAEVGVKWWCIREPGGTRLGERLREILLQTQGLVVHEWAELLLYTASRAQQVHETVRSRLERGTWILADRYVDATLAYQGYGRGLDPEKIRTVHQWATGGLWPDITVLLDCPVDTARRRRMRRPGATDRLEAEDAAFHRRVRAGYLELAQREPQRYLVIDASPGFDRVWGECCRRLQARLQETGWDESWH